LSGNEGYNTSYFGQCTDFRHARLGFVDLSKMDLSGSLFDDAVLEKVIFDGATLDGARFERTNFKDASFVGAKAKNAVFNNAQLGGANLSLFEGDGIPWQGADLANADLSFTKCGGCDFTDAAMSGAKLLNSNILQADFTRTDLSQADLTSADFKGCTFTGANFTAAVLSDTSMKEADFTASKLGAAILRGTDFSGANLKKADLRMTKIESSLFVKTHLEEADLGTISLKDSDLSGAYLTGAKFNKRSVLPFDKDEALKLGMLFVENRSVFMIWDAKDDHFNDFVRYLTDQGSDITLSAEAEYDFKGEVELLPYDAVIHLNGSTYNKDMNASGQKALVEYVKNGGTFIYGEWNSYEYNNNSSMREMRDLTLLDSSATTEDVQFKSADGQSNHPLVMGLAFPFTVTGSFGLGKIHPFDQDPSTSIVKDANGNDLVVVRHFGKGRVIGFAFSGNFDSNYNLDNPNIRQLYSNAVQWQK
jgi:uncharacterized protein YjbI with pentapeptide repeats